MGRHSSPTGRRLAPTLVLGLTLISVGSPLGLILATQPAARVETEANAETSTAPPMELQLTSPTSTSRHTTKKSTPTKTKVRQTPTSVPPTPTTTTARPSVAEQQVQRATAPTVTPKPTITQPKPTPKAQIARQTTSTTRAPTRAPTSVTTKKTTTALPPPPTKTTPKTTTAQSSSDPPKALPPSHQLLAQVAQKYVGRGIPYQMGGNSLTGGMDCSHFVWMVLKEAGYNTAYRPSDALAAWVIRTTTPQLGDLVLFRGHVGIFVGNGKMVDQGSAGGAHLREIKYYNNFIGYGRIPL